MHIFPYSIRKGTRAEKLTGHLDKSIKDERCKILAAETDKIRCDFFRNQIGKTYGVLIESETKDGYFTGHTANYIPVKVKLPQDYQGSIVDVKIIDVCDDDHLIGELI